MSASSYVIQCPAASQDCGGAQLCPVFDEPHFLERHSHSHEKYVRSESIDFCDHGINFRWAVWQKSIATTNDEFLMPFS
jgi:hypothetical protein